MPTVVFDLDGTIVRTDLLHEQLLLYVKYHPLAFWKPAWWLLKGGRTQLKGELAVAVRVNVTALPYREALVQRARAEMAKGNQVILASASAQPVVEDIAAYLGCFSRAIGTTRGANLKGSTKLERLIAEHAGPELFYVGNSIADLEVWRGTGGGGIAVNPSPRLLRQLRQLATPVTTLEDAPPRVATWLRAMRWKQWVKNALLFVPVIGAHQLTDLPRLGAATAAAIAFCLASSAVYLLNDLFDLEPDRLHHSKRHRPIAAGDFPIAAAAMLAPALALAAATIAFLVSPAFLGMLLGYFTVNLFYTFRLKHLLAIDVIVLALLYSLRVFAGGVATDTPISPWLTAFTTFFFFALAILKRYVEVQRAMATDARVAGRDYRGDDAGALLALGAGTHLVSLLVLTLYFNSPVVAELYPRADLLWLILPFLLYWVMRTWILAHRGVVDDDPVLFALRDRATHVVLGGCALVAMLAGMG